MQKTIADNAFVRTAGSLSEQVDAGGVSESQIDAALDLAYSRMVQLFTKSVYVAVRDYSGSDADLLEKTERFKNGEACLTISKLPFSVSSAQLSRTGIKDSVQTGKATTTFASMEEGRKDRRGWEDEAYRWLAPYLATQGTNANNTPVVFRSKRKTFSIAGCDPDDNIN